ncbi:hypothetical protein V1460_18815 [Streptomyces sp. SCSIO 30461]
MRQTNGAADEWFRSSATTLASDWRQLKIAQGSDDRTAGVLVEG